MSGAQDQLFREAALKRVSSPEDLSRLVRITRPMGWLAGMVFAAILVGTLIWSVVGRLPSRVLGEGILLPQGGRETEIQSHGSGVLSRLLVKVGDKVSLGEEVAQLDAADSARELADLQSNLADRERELTTAELAAQAEDAARLETQRRQLAALTLRTQNDNSQIQVLSQRLSSTQALYTEQLVTRPQLIQVQNDLANARLDLSNTQSEIARLGGQDLAAQRASAVQLEQRRRAVADTQQHIESLQARRAESTTVRAGEAGTVTEVRAQEGSLVHEGQGILEIEQPGTGLELTGFVDAQRGKQIVPGMEVRAALSSVRREEFGMLVGHVASVSAFPLSFEAIRTIIANDALAQSFMSSGPPFLVSVQLDADPHSVSGYRWTSNRGGTVPISSGATASIEVVTEWRRPIAMVIPALQDILRK